ncbi:glutamine amidotransferase-related protein [Oceanobacter mangrovi]|uniref:glutamine amidotransferase-related protein n=1 Tax=Oceanobacter mangrovi TaxID=2862510 RepID=UPI001C8EB139|nr:GMP synthase [Oceanobacter mangrovi]
MIRLGILETDVLYDDLRDDYGSYGMMFRRFFDELSTPLAKQLEYRHYQVTDLQLPQCIDECDAWLITGSKSGVYDPLPWQQPLADHARRCFDAGIPMLGVCFGHQFLAHNLGGHAGLSDQGWGIGVRASKVINQPAWSQVHSSHIRLIYSHRDQVTALPPGATRLSGCGFCQNAAFNIDRRVLAFQGHPEFTPTYLRRLLPRRKDVIGSRYQRGMATVDVSNDSQLVGNWMLEFLNWSLVTQPG